ncbi:uncharacterized protein LOC121240897 [Juglans microcarpa x Juglans regia]|uniref:uncharacterized protein LOC121240897 n=1 Tax=Juglans microcarpa x Juglans regia TaxID=2249226 RepID=UPI001B7E4B64|nr:uncharacterized protein LOC121240897 [Juglans microcarpa x Juglans regia]
METKHFSHEHPLVFVERLEGDGKKELVCSGCEESVLGICYKCSVCDFFLHKSCYELPQEIQHPVHPNHSCSPKTIRGTNKHMITPSLALVLCIKLRSSYTMYYCQECDYVAHLLCTYDKLLMDGSVDISVTLDALFEEIRLEEGGVVGEIKHFSHQHNLCLGDKELEDDKFCEGCGQLILDSFYKCEQCKFFLHESCAKLPKKKRHLLHQHPLTLNSRGDCMFYCSACKHPHRGFSYKCDECYYNLDIQCISLPETFKHEGHQHSLFLAISSMEKCKACDSSSNSYGAFFEPVFVCTECDFVLGFECASLPHEARYDTHLLKLTHIPSKMIQENIIV